MMNFPLFLCLALLLDTLLGDPPRLPHPTRGVGWLVSFWERWLYGKRAARLRGVLLCFAVLGSTALAVKLLMFIARRNALLLAAVQLYLLYAALAWRSLKDETRSVASALFRRNLQGARTALSRVVGRDTLFLQEPAIVRAAVETVAENAVDGIISVIFYAALGYALGGPAGMVLSTWLFKAASTLDSMVGYDDSRYHAFGWASARLDDALNFIPARLGGLVIVLAGGCLGYPLDRGFRVLFRDRLKHKSPNSAHAESAFAGVLGLRLGGGASYGGVFEPRPWLGPAGSPLRGDAPSRNPEPSDILRAHKLLDASCTLFTLLTLSFFLT